MPTITVQLACSVRRSFRVEQVAGMFDVPLGERVRHELRAEVPGVDEPWTIGAIVGPSGSGKTTLAKAAFGHAAYRMKAWPRDRALIDCFGEIPIKQLTVAFTAVGLGSPPAWLKPYRVLSMGERFRADLMKAILSVGLDQVVVVDEFSSLLDRTIAKTASAAIAKFIRYVPDELRARLVAVTCHRDILPWLAPDWTIEVGQGIPARSASEGSAGGTSNTLAGASGWYGMTARLIRGRPRRPSFRFHVERVPQALWTRFAPHHYLSGGLAASATCYGALWNKEPIAFCAVVAALGHRGVKRIQRLVTLPEFQGMGIGGKLLDIVAWHESRRGFRVTITASHPAILAHCAKSPRWRYMDLKKAGSTRQQFDGREIRSSIGRAVAAFEFVRD